MRKTLITLIVFITLLINTSQADNLNQNDLDNFVCNYYEEIMKQVHYLIDKEEYDNAEKELEPLYYSKCKTKDVAEAYLHILYKLQKFDKGYEIAQKENLLNSKYGVLLQVNKFIAIKNYSISRSVYDNILIKSPYDKFAQMGLTHSYISTSSELTALSELSELALDNDTAFLKAKTYFNLEMYEDAYKILKTLPQNEEVIELENQIKRKRAYLFVTGYEMYIQKLNDEYKLDVSKAAVTNACYIKNMQVFLDYILYVYTSGILVGQGPEPLNNITNEIRLGTQGRLTDKIALRTDLGVKVFQDYGAMILTDTWFQYFVNDALNIKVGYHRNNAEQTFLSAVGVMIDNKFTGQVADNNFYLDATLRLPRKYYVFGKGGIGFKDGYNLPINLYWEGMGGFGRLLRFNPQKPYLQKISLDIVSYNAGYKKNLENLYDSHGLLYGGYFSPVWYSDDTLNLNIAGEIKRKFAYGIGTFIGWQYAIKPYQSFLIYGSSVYGKYRLNNHLSAELQYRYYRYANVTRNQLLFDLVISLFKKDKHQ